MAFELAITDQSGVTHPVSYWYPALIELNYERAILNVTYKPYHSAETTNKEAINVVPRVISLQGVEALKVLAAFFAGTDPLDLLDDLALKTKDVVRFEEAVDEEGNPTRLAVWESFFKNATRIKPVLNLPESEDE